MKDKVKEHDIKILLMTHKYDILFSKDSITYVKKKKKKTQ